MGPFEELLKGVYDSIQRDVPDDVFEEETRHLFPSLPEAIVCTQSDCAAIFCSASCRDDAVLHNSVSTMKPLCSALDISLFSNSPNVRLGIAAICLLLIQRAASYPGRDIDSAISSLLSDFVTVPFSRHIQENGGEPVSFDSLEEMNVGSEIWDEPLRSKMDKLRRSFIDCGMDPESRLLKCGFLDKLLGLIHLNAREIRLYSPLLDFLNRVQRTDQAMPFLPLIFRLERNYGGIPNIVMSSLCETYACLNHACQFNVAASRSEDEDIADTARTGCAWSTLLLIFWLTMQLPLKFTRKLSSMRVMSSSPHTLTRIDLWKSVSVFAERITDSVANAASVYKNWHHRQPKKEVDDEADDDSGEGSFLRGIATTFASSTSSRAEAELFSAILLFLFDGDSFSSSSADTILRKISSSATMLHFGEKG